MHHYGYLDQSVSVSVRIADGRYTMGVSALGGLGVTPGPVEIILDVTPDLSQPTTFSPTGLSLGGQHSWKYSYRFEGILLQ